ncbi:MAG: arginine--tRNA ligase [Fidelibacterota bacterium]
MNLETYLNKALSRAADSLGIALPAYQLTPPRNHTFGDLSTNLALLLAKPLKKNPLRIAEEIKDHLELDSDWIQRVTVTPPGFINFTISPNYLYRILNDILTRQDDFGKSGTGGGKTANVEFVSANPTGPLTVGHGRQAVLGDTVASILSWHGYQVTREYYYNDAGRQMRVLGQSVEARYFQALGRDVPLPEEGYQGHYLKDVAAKLIKVYGDQLPPNDSRFRQAAEEMIFSEIKTALQDLGIVHDVFTNEKIFYDNGDIEDIVSALRDRDLAYDAEGATWFRTTKLGKDQDRVLIKSSGEPTYRLPDMAYHRHKLQRKYDLIVDLFGADHQDTYPDVLAALEALGYDTSAIRVLIHQFVTLIRHGEVVKMSTRKANFITLSNLTQQVGKDVVRYFFIMRGMNSHLNFDLDLAQDQSDKNPVFYLQYAHARIANILKRGETAGFVFNREFQPHGLTHPVELDLLKSLANFPAVMLAALDSLEPQSIANYLQDLATGFHRFYTDCRVLTDDKDLSQARLALIRAVQIVMRNGLNLLGIQAPDRM